MSFDNVHFMIYSLTWMINLNLIWIWWWDQYDTILFLRELVFCWKPMYKKYSEYPPGEVVLNFLISKPYRFVGRYTDPIWITYRT